MVLADPAEVGLIDRVEAELAVLAEWVVAHTASGITGFCAGPTETDEPVRSITLKLHTSI